MHNRFPYPRIYEAYEEAIGVSTPAVIHELNSAVKRWPEQWIVEAIRRAAAEEQPSWRYAQRLLMRREREQPTPPVSQNNR